MQSLDWDESRLTALRLSGVLLDNIQQTQGRSTTVGNISLVAPTTRTVDLDEVHYTAAQKMLDFLTSDQFDGGPHLRAAALEAAVKTRTTPNLVQILANHSFTAKFHTEKQATYHHDISRIEKEIEILKSRQERKPSAPTKDTLRIWQVQLESVRKKNMFTIPYALVPQVWADVINDTIAKAEKALSIGAAYVRNPDDAIKTQEGLSRNDILQHRQKGSEENNTPPSAHSNVKFQ